MQPKSVNEKTLMMPSVGLKASKGIKIVRLFNLILKILSSTITNELSSKCLNVAETKM